MRRDLDVQRHRAAARAAPDGIDVYFDNVGGGHLEAALNAARPFGRFAMCGAISMYNATDLPPGPRNLFFVVGKQLTLRGFIVSTHWDMMADFHRDLGEWIKAGRFSWKETVKEGIENAPDAFLGLFKGENLGKMLVKLG